MGRNHYCYRVVKKCLCLEWLFGFAFVNMNLMDFRDLIWLQFPLKVVGTSDDLGIMHLIFNPFKVADRQVHIIAFH